MKVAVGCDHAGFDLKSAVCEALEREGAEIVDLGTYSHSSVDYPDFGERVARAVAAGEVDRGIVICGTGIGISIAANKVGGVRAALCHDTYSARMSRAHNDANVLALGSRVVGPGLAQDVVSAWLGAEFAGGRHTQRVEKLRKLDASDGAEEQQEEVKQKEEIGGATQAT